MVGEECLKETQLRSLGLTGGKAVIRYGHIFFNFIYLELASVAQSDACSMGDQEVVGLIRTRSDDILSWRLDHEIFSTVILSFLLIQVHSCFSPSF